MGPKSRWWGGVGSGGYLRPDQFLDHLTVIKDDRLEDSFANFRSKILLKISDQVGQGRRAALFTGPADNLSPCEKLPVV